MYYGAVAFCEEQTIRTKLSSRSEFDSWKAILDESYHVSFTVLLEASTPEELDKLLFS